MYHRAKYYIAFVWEQCRLCKLSVNNGHSDFKKGLSYTFLTWLKTHELQLL